MGRAIYLLLGVASLAACASSPEPAAGKSYADYLIARVANMREDHAIASDRFYAALQGAPGGCVPA